MPPESYRGSTAVAFDQANFKPDPIAGRYVGKPPEEMPADQGDFAGATERPLTQSVTWSHPDVRPIHDRSEEHTSELQSLRHLVCRLLLEKKKTKLNSTPICT